MLTKKGVWKKCKVHSFQIGTECFPFGVTDQFSSGNNVCPCSHFFSDPGCLGINTHQCTCRDCAEAAASLSSQLGQRLLQQKACFPSSMENLQELSTELMPCHARRRWLAIFCFMCPSSCSKVSPGTTRRACAAWCTRGSPKPWAAPSPGSMRPQLQSRGSGGPFNSAWRCSLEERSLHVPRIKVVPILMHFS